MAGRVVVSTLNNDTGPLATQNGMTGIPKAWGSFAGASGAVSASFNVSSVTRTGVGTYTIAITTALPSANYTVLGAGSAVNQGAASSLILNTAVSQTASQFGLIACAATPTPIAFDPTVANFAVFSS
jgi:hypothetical protein